MLCFASINVITKEKRPVVALIVFLWWLLPDLNRGHKALQASALPAELKSLITG